MPAPLNDFKSACQTEQAAVAAAQEQAEAHEEALEAELNAAREEATHARSLQQTADSLRCIQRPKALFRWDSKQGPRSPYSICPSSCLRQMTFDVDTQRGSQEYLYSGKLLPNGERRLQTLKCVDWTFNKGDRKDFTSTMWECKIQIMKGANRVAAEGRVQNLEAELQERESAFDVSLKEQLEREQASSTARQAVVCVHLSGQHCLSQHV